MRSFDSPCSLGLVNKAGVSVPKFSPHSLGRQNSGTETLASVRSTIILYLKGQ
jgi:hypothetical protein